ncbi:hypothetical protein BH23ACT5_BH23ACT5_22390 [soil metagenome]
MGAGWDREQTKEGVVTFAVIPGLVAGFVGTVVMTEMR